MVGGGRSYTAGMHQHAPGGSDPAGRAANRRRLGIVLALAATYMVAEVVGGLLTGSLALLADAAHMLSDVAALALALAANWIASRPAGHRFSYGMARAEILAALAQGAALVAVAVLVAIEAIERLQAPPAVQGLGVFAIATGGLVVNLVGLWILNAGKASSLNVRGAWLHVLSDALGSLGAMASGLLVWGLGWAWADPAVSLLIAALVLFSAWHLLREAVDVLMEATPRNLDLDRIRESLASLANVTSVHDLHVWSIGSGEICLSCHVVVADSAAPSDVLAAAYHELGSQFGIDHATLQVEPQSFEHQTPRSVCAGACDPAA